MSNTVLHRAETRGHSSHGWLNSYHTFSFANYWDPERIHFGALRVLNDDTVEAGMGFGLHPHDNMEIISIPLEGDLEHKDSMSNTSVIHQGDIQVMSAGTGIFHSEYNHSKSNRVKFLQIWVMPDRKNVAPRYDQISLNPADRHNRFEQFLSPSADNPGVWIYQNAWFHMGRFDKGQQAQYRLKNKDNGVYLFLISGEANVNGQSLKPRDGYGMWNIDTIGIFADTDAEILLMEVPMQ